MNREELMQKFQRIYEQLNTEQKKAVDQIDGPVLVIAGPGTGKTQILSARIGKILLETDYLPENILCLTYTDAGRTAMRKRLQEMIGADAYAVNIHTFHSFCHQIIQENVSLFEKNSLDPVSDLERIEILREVINGFKEGNPLKRYRGDVYYEIKRLASFFSEMKKEAWTSDWVRNNVNAYIVSLPERDEFIYKTSRKGSWQKGDIKQKQLDEETRKAELLLHASDAFDVFQRLMFDRNLYDFDDMISWVIRALKTNTSLLLDQQEKYQYVLVDEFQDTSGSQNQIIDLLCQDIEVPNVFVVGDDDQSIYRFQGANIQNIEDYKRKYQQHLKDVILQSNYRSTQSILDIARYVIDQNQQRLSVKFPEIVKKLLAKNPKRIESSVQPLLQVYENTFQEMVGVTNKVHELIQQGTAPERIAILYKENKWGDEILKFFKEKNIPFYSKRKENLMSLPLAKKLLTILRYIAAERDIPYSADDLLFEILHFDIYGIPPFEIAKASVMVHEKRMQTKSSLRTYLQEWIQTKNPSLFENKPHGGIIEITGLLEKWIGESFNITVIQLLENILLEGRFLETALNDREHTLWNLEILRSFMDFVKDEMHRHPENSLADLMTVVDLMEQQDLSIALYRVYGNENGVNLMTTHGSKGLEFQHVFLMNSVSSVWEKKSARNHGYKLPDNFYRSSDTNADDSGIEELRRLFYVAITRAEEHLYLSWSQKDEKEKLLEPSQFIAEITDKVPLPIEKQRVPEAQMIDFMRIYLHRNKQPLNTQGEREFIAALLDRFEMNATALNNYLNCPLRFYYQNLIRVPGGRSENSEFGSAVHHALEKFFTKAKEQDDVFPSIDTMIKDFEWYMYKHRESFTKEAYQRRLEYGNTVLRTYHDANIDEWRKHQVYSIERLFRNIVIDGVPVKGMIDKMIFDGKHVTIVDYKTGDPEKAKSKLVGPSGKYPNGGDYWRQGVFYKLMVEAYKLKDYQVTKTEFNFVEPDTSKKYVAPALTSVIPSPEEEGIVRAQIKDTWHKIQQHDFYTGCGEENCQWCNFVKEHKLYHDLKELDTDENEENDL